MPTVGELGQVLAERNRTAPEYAKEKCIHELFAEETEHNPDAVALVYEDRAVSYRELNERSNQLAHCLRDAGVGPDTLVAICLERSSEMIVGILGILKAGGAYVPMDPSYPEERLAFMLEDTQAAVLLTNRSLQARLPRANATTICLDGNFERIDNQCVSAPTNLVTPANLAYVIYTSGSTGEPKGVLIEHAGIVNLVCEHRRHYSRKEGIRISQITHAGFDAMASEIWPALLSGATLCIAPDGVRADPEALQRWLIDQRIVIASVTTVIAEWLLALSWPEEGVALRVLRFGGERFRGRPANRQYPFKVYNEYGPTEDTVWTTVTEVVDDSARESSIGRPIANHCVYVLDGDRNPVPAGEAGELCIGGVGLARGYLNRPELTAEKFITNPFSKDPTDRLYRSGDLVRHLPDGSLAFLGRIDDQVKIRGFRVELGEIETVLSGHPAVGQCVVVARENALGDKQLVAYVAARIALDKEHFDSLAGPQCTERPQALDGNQEIATHLRGYLSGKLPEYMVPSAFVFLNQLPLTANGKVDRRALAQTGPSAGEFVQPQTPLQRKLAEVWQTVLGVQRVGLEDNFFDLGGHSLLAVRLANRLGEIAGQRVGVSLIFQAPTIAQLAEELGKNDITDNDSNDSDALSHDLGLKAPQHGGNASGAGDRVERNGIRRNIHQGRIPLSFNQERLWFLSQLEPESPAYNLPIWLRFEGELNVSALRRCVNEVLRRHEVLRTRIESVEGRPVQVVDPFTPLDIPLVDLTGLVAERREVEAQRLCIKEAQQPFDLARDLMLRARLFRLGEVEHILFLNRHHIASDGWSWGVLMRELEALYSAFSKEQPSPLAELPIQYVDFAVWQREWLQSDVLEKQLNYWRKQLDPIPAPLELPTDRRPQAPNYGGALQSQDLPESLSLAIAKLSRREGVTLFMTLLAAFQTLLHRYTNRHDVPVGSVVAARNRLEVEGLIGFFANTLVLRGDLSGDPSFRVLLQRSRTLCMGAYANQDVPFGELVKELQPERDMSHSPLFQVVFVLQNTPPPAMAFPGLRVTAADLLDTGGSKFELTLSVKERGKTLNATVEYRTDLFDAETVQRMLHHYQTLLEGIIADPDARLSELPLLSEPERAQTLLEWNRTETEYPKQRCVHELFAEQAKRRPDAVAVVYGDEKLSYRELDRRTNQLAHYLRTIGVGAETLVGICMERSLQMVVGILGILKAGGAYVPLDPSYPKERLGFMLEDTQASVVLSLEEFTALLPRNVRVVTIDRERKMIARQSTAPVDSAIKPYNLAYVIYTSGSTGIPKGVMVEHRAIVRLVCNTNYISLDSSDRVAQVSNASFDAITFELWGALLNGAALVGINRVASLEPAVLGEKISEHSISTLFLTTSLFNQIAAESPLVFSKVRNLIIGGETADAERIKSVLDTAPPRRLINAYGPTENTTFSTWYLANSITDSVPIGRPIANSRAYVLDEQLRPVPIGITGELFLAGDGLARGYLNRPELTSEKFIPNPLPEEPAERLYRTGDLVRWRADGELEFLGRMDHQVKIRGYRIEPGEIESVLRQHEQVKDCAAVAREDRPGDKRLVAYLVVKQKAERDATAFRSYLKSKLPDYMVPANFVVLESLPLTPNGKLDFKALPEPELDRTDLLEEYVEPLAPMEKALAEIWAKVLGVERVGVNDNFFELGGHSLLAVRLFSQIEKSLAHKLPIASLFRAPTIAALTALINQPDRTDGWSPLVAIQTRGDRLPFFGVHCGFGQVLFYRALAQLLGPNQPFYGFQSQGLDGRPFQHTSMEAIASYYIEEMRRVQAHGPYFLGGYCTGGMIAFEMAQQLQAAGEEIALLVLFDAQNPAESSQRYTRVQRVKLRFQYGSRLAPGEQIRYFAEQLDGHLKKWQERFKKLRYRMLNIDVGAGAVPDEFRQLHVLLSLERAREAYKPRTYPGRITLFRATSPGEYFRYTADYIADLGWTKLAGGGLEIHHIAGDHVTMFGESNIAVTAEKLGGLLRLSKQRADFALVNADAIGT